MAQAVGHGVIFSRVAGGKYSPGFLASFFLHAPIGISYIRALNSEEKLNRTNVVKGVAYAVAFAMVAVAGPNIVAKDKNSPYAFTKEQMGHHDIEVA